MSLHDALVEKLQNCPVNREGFPPLLSRHMGMRTADALEDILHKCPSNKVIWNGLTAPQLIDLLQSSDPRGQEFLDEFIRESQNLVA